MTLMRQVFCLPFPTYNDGSGMYNLNKTFGFTKRGTWRLKEFTTSPTPKGRGLCKRQKTRRQDHGRASIDIAYHSARLFDSNDKRNNILEKYFMKLEG